MAHLKVGRVLIILVGLLSITCSEEEVKTRSYPVIDTKVVTNINEEGANLNAEILNIGNSGIKDHGFVYDDESNPSLNKSDRISLGETTQKGSFSILANRNLVKDKRYYVKAYAITKDNDFIVYGQEVEFVSLGSKVPTINSFFPQSGVIGDTITALGSGFSNVISNNEILVGTIKARIIKASADSLIFIVPDLSIVGENDLKYRLGVSSLSFPKKFTLLAATITSVSKQSVNFGDTITIIGENFPKIPSLISASILEQEAVIVSLIPNQIKLAISNNIAIDEALSFLQIGTQKVNFNAPTKLLPPEILEFIPTLVKQGENLRIKGKNFSPVAVKNKILVGTIPAEITSASLTEITIKVPEIKAGAYVSTIQRVNQTVTSSQQFSIIGPIIEQTSPSESSWNEIITIKGSGFSPIKTENIVKIGNTECVVTSASETELSVQISLQLLSSNVPITVFVPSKNSIPAVAPSNFQFKKMVISSFTPTQGKKNQIVEIFGSNLYPFIENQQVSFGNYVAFIVAATKNSVHVRLPEGLIDSQVPIKIKVGVFEATSNSNFHLISPWKRLRDFPESFKNGFSFVINNRPFVGATINEFQSNRSNALWEYRLTDNSWINKRAISEYANGLTSFQFGNFGWAGLGLDSKTLQIYNPSSNLWSVALPEFPGDPTTGASVFTIGSNTYITNGTARILFPTQTGFFIGSLPSLATYKFDHNAQAWSRLGNSPGTVIGSFIWGRFKAATFKYNDTAYLFGGSIGVSGNPIVADLLAYNSQTDQWQTFGNVGVPGRFDAAALSIDSYGYLIGGETNTLVLNDVWRFDMNSLTWEKLENFPGQARAGAVAFVVGGKIYYGAGFGMKDFWEFDPSKL